PGSKSESMIKPGRFIGKPGGRTYANPSAHQLQYPPFSCGGFDCVLDSPLNKSASQPARSCTIMEKRIESDRTIASVPGDVLIIGAAATATILLCAVPLTFWAGVYRIYTLPRFVLLITGSAILATTLGLLGIESRVTGRSYFRDLKTTHVLILVLYTAWIACSSLLATNQQVALFGSFENQMGFLTRGSFLLCSLGLLVGIGRSQQRLETVIWSLALTGLAVGAY